MGENNHAMFFTNCLKRSPFIFYACKAESYWLILQNSNYGIEKIEIKNIDQCKEQGEEYSKSLGIPRYR